jgi:hypothetical protein
MAKIRMNVEQFSAHLLKIGKGLPAEKLNKLMRFLAFEGLGRLILKTPVDTGRARGNWQVAADPDVDELDNFDKEGTTVFQDGIDDATQLLGSNPFISVFISNTVPYIERLEDGHSSQGRAMLEMTFQELISMFDQDVKEEV